jgi:hypothetical protein
MTKLIHTYSLQAFPTEKVLKEFKPTRGFVAKGLLELSPEQELKLTKARSNHGDDPLAWKEPVIEPDLRPLFGAISERLGYDLRLLTEGKGETGQPGHSWTNYAHDGGCPFLIRWQAEQGQLLLSIAVSPPYELTIAVLADAAGEATLAKVGDILASIEGDAGRSVSLDIPAGNTLLKTEISTKHGHGGFESNVMVCLPPGQELNSLRRKELELLAFAIPLAVVPLEEKEFGLTASKRRPLLAANCLRLNGIRGGAMDLDFGPDEPLNLSILQAIWDRGFDLATETMNQALSGALDYMDHKTIRDNRLLFWSKELLDVELAERKAKLRSLVGETMRFKGGRLSFGWDVRDTPGEILRGTRPVAKMLGGDVLPSVDVLEMLFHHFQMMASPGDHLYLRGPKPKLQLKGEVKLPSVAENYGDSAKDAHHIEDLRHPYYGSHLGLPVRIDKRLIVWREGDTEALAADFFHLPATRDTYFTHLQKVKVPIPKN